jgi:Ca2+-transporting ATPase
VKLVAVLALSLCLAVVLIHGFVRGSWLDGFLAGITLAMAILPEEFPVVLTVFLALGAWRMSRQNVLTRHVPAIEALGSATLLAVDKTGTLTLNRMVVKQLLAGGLELDLDLAGDDELKAPHAELLEFAVLACERDPHDPMERAIVDLGDRSLPQRRSEHARWSLAREYPLSSALLAHTHAWQTGTGGRHAVATKGAPEAVAALCRLDASERQALEAQVTRMASRGLRVLGVARAQFQGNNWPVSPTGLEFTWLGLIGLADPVRPTVAAALAECYRAGIRVAMITGDYPATARAIAREIGLTPHDTVITGPQIEAMSAEELQSRVGQCSIYARVTPVQKLRLIEAYKANREVVAMTGDGVNDAPALKAAHIGIAMGGRGTDVAREAASLVLLDDDFDSIVRAVRLGRRIYRNIRNAMCYILAVHVPTAGMAFIPLLFGWPLAFFPVHIVFFEFVIDPACSIAFEAEPIDDSVMRQPPRPIDERLFDLRTVVFSLLQGTSVLLAVALVYGYSLTHGSDEAHARAMAFATIVFGNLGLILANRSRSRTLLSTLTYRNRALWWVIGGTLAALFAVLYSPYLRTLFQLASPDLPALLLCLGAAVVALSGFELYKYLHTGAAAMRAN